MMHSKPFRAFKYKEEDCPIPTAQESNHEDVKWTTEKTDISFAEVIVEKQLRQNCKVANTLLVDVKDKFKFDTEGCLVNPQEVANHLRNRIDLLLSCDASLIEKRNELLSELKMPSKLWYKNMHSMRAALGEYKKKTFHDSVVEVILSNKFSKGQMCMINLEFLPDEFFFCDTKSIKTLRENSIFEPTRLQQKHIEMNDNEKSNMRSPMIWEQEANNIDFRYGDDASNSRFFFKTTARVLKEVCGAVPETVEYTELIDLFTSDIKLGYLKTIKEELQSPHTDYEHEPIRKNMDKMERKGSPPYLPWSFDMPHNPHGLRLAMWGTEYPQSDEEKLYQIPVDVKVPAKHLLLWRGDLIHGGCLNDPNGNTGALRQHAFLPLHRQHTGLGNDSDNKNNGRLGNASRKRLRYDEFLYGFHGERI